MGRTEEHKEEWKKGERGIEGREGDKIGERREKGGREEEKNKGRW